ncbi:MAG: DUF6456 domain-containing protein [Xanthobacteraceae bacterium]
MLHKVAAGEGARSAPGSPCDSDAELIAADLAERNGDGVVSITAAGRAWIARQNAALRALHLDPYVAQHLSLSARDIDAAEGRRAVVVDDNESPLGWLARRKGRDGQPLLAAHQLSAGERLRAEFTRAQLMPRVTSNWQAAVSQGSRAENSGRANISDTIVAAPAGTAGARCRRAGILRIVDRRLLLSQRPGRCRAGANLARAQRQDRSAIRA